MKKAELLTQLGLTFYKVGEIADAESSPTGKAIRAKEGITWQSVGVYETDEAGEVMVRRQVLIYVADEGTEDEQAFYAEKKPALLLKPAVTETAAESTSESTSEPVAETKNWFQKIFNA